MDKEQINQSLQLADLISGYIRNELTDTQLKQLSEWIEARAENRIMFEKICNERNLDKTHQFFKAYPVDLALQKVKIELGIIATQKSKVRVLWPRIGIAAAMVATIAIGIYFFKAPLPPKPVSESKYANDVVPGKNTATLIINNQGKTINLSDAKTGVIISDGKLAYSDGALIQNSGALLPDVNEPMTLKTPPGGTYQITLSDGTKVWLNAASSLTYTAALNEYGQRRVKLQGEGYFEVAKDKSHPFVVESKGQEVTVLGTHFNINSYPDEEAIRTTLLEGSVHVSFKNTSKVLKPGEQSVLTDQLEVKQVDTRQAIDWKEGSFYFADDNLRTVMRKVARWYDVEVVYKTEVPNFGFGGEISMTKNLSEVLKILETTGKIHFKIEGRRVIVMK